MVSIAEITPEIATAFLFQCHTVFSDSTRLFQSLKFPGGALKQSNKWRFYRLSLIKFKRIVLVNSAGLSCLNRTVTFITVLILFGTNVLKGYFNNIFCILQYITCCFGFWPVFFPLLFFLTDISSQAVILACQKWKQYIKPGAIKTCLAIKNSDILWWPIGSHFTWVPKQLQPLLWWLLQYGFLLCILLYFYTGPLGSKAPIFILLP